MNIWSFIFLQNMYGTGETILPLTHITDADHRLKNDEIRDDVITK